MATQHSGDGTKMVRKMECLFSGRSLDKKDTFGKSDPYLVISQLTDDDETGILEVGRTAVIKKTLDPKWEAITVTIESSDRRDVHLKICCYDYDIDKEDQLIGEFYTSVSEMMKARDSNVHWDLINPRKLQNKGNYKHSGVITLSSLTVLK